MVKTIKMYEVETKRINNNIVVMGYVRAMRQCVTTVLHSMLHVSVLRGGGDLIDTKFTDSADILRMCSMYQKFSIFVFNENV